MEEDGFIPLFNGTDLSGWFATRRGYGPMWPGQLSVLEAYPHAFPADYDEQSERHPALWTVEDGVLTGRQDPNGNGYGGYLVTERTFEDFELRLEAKPDWPADTGVLARYAPSYFQGIQILMDHRTSGSLGGIFGNGIGLFEATPFPLTVVEDENGTPVGLQEARSDTPFNTWTPSNRALLDHAATAEEFLKVWRFGEWNTLCVRVEGRSPRVTTWINGLKIAELDMATLQAPNYDAEAVAACLGGHIALEVHDTDWGYMAEQRWGRNAACRWRNIRIKPL